MISRLRGTLREQRDTSVLLDVHGVCYEVFVPPSILRVLSDRVERGGEVELVTFHYQQLEVGRGTPVLIGFLNEVEREFFERFITVSGVGPKAALRALTQPIPSIAKAIDEGNMGVLKSLPGIGEQRAREIVAKLQGKIGKFALIQAKDASAQAAPTPQTALEEEAIAILVQLEYKTPEAKQMVKAALERSPHVKTAEELLNEVYRQQRLVTEPAQV
jgi:Holliday junction DNA helicase RuvA